jgi:HD-GYP domain-containing protein (c-di-GMP phosphodiesterase class II)
VRGFEKFAAAILHRKDRLRAVPLSRVLEKPSELNDQEWVEMRAHAGHTGEILGRIGALQGLASIAAAHHERPRWQRLSVVSRSELDPIESRIIAVADIFGALTADRSIGQRCHSNLP